MVIDRGVPGSGPALRLAGSQAFHRLHASYVPANPCCDRFAYRLTARYRGGATKTVTTVGGAAAPQILWDLIGLTEDVGRHAPR